MHNSPDYFKQQDKHLVIFDFDETICKTNATIKVTNIKMKKEMYLTPTQYSHWRATKKYEESPDDWHMDFSEFQGYPHDGQPNEEVIRDLRWYADNDQYIVALVTGRDNLLGPKQFMKDYYVPVNKMMLLCSGSPNKRNCFRSLFETFEPKHVTIYEDAPQYIEQCLEIAEQKKIPFSGILVKDGSLVHDWRKYENSKAR
tara:strand:- start:307 stop:906 length:600 start_codon:yes stop_codon:yes gene_type:complete